MNLSIMFNCGAAAKTCDKSQYQESSLLDRILMKMHHLMCRVCREHSAENTKLTNALQKADVKTLTRDEKEHIRKKVQQEIAK